MIKVQVFFVQNPADHSYQNGCAWLITSHAAAKVYCHASTAINWTMPLSADIFIAQLVQKAHVTEIGAQ